MVATYLRHLVLPEYAQCCHVICCDSAPDRHPPISSIRGFMNKPVLKPFISTAVYTHATITATKDKSRLICERHQRLPMSCPQYVVVSP
ncbi:hypothetical protein PoB_004048300 [Plakobranchus ocellatus]|uniref:Secreted protein n=1 Tax=Plakobranchus ocellatus TaxID=259542 RepID=A0AAV4B5E2_9GAST|nr:hypothetical protein PoB_004048300 [Plakobranchus ocellatus]